jgi:hypothetical protein
MYVNVPGHNVKSGFPGEFVALLCCIVIDLAWTVGIGYGSKRLVHQDGFQDLVLGTEKARGGGRQ